MKNIKDKKLFLLDMDGTIYHENTLIPGVKEFFNLLKKQNKDYVFMTNNSSKSKFSYVDKLKSLGIEVTTKNIASSINATINYLNQYHQKDKIYLVGTKSFKEELLLEGFDIVPWDYSELDVNCVVVGFDTELTYEKIEKACFYINQGAKYLATNCDLRCPIKDNKYLPDCGAICQMIEIATQLQPHYLGKPDRHIVDFVSSTWNVALKDIICIGDRLYTDIAVGINAGVDTAVVLTGEAKLEDLDETPFKPSYCFDSIKEIYEMIRD